MLNRLFLTLGLVFCFHSAAHAVDGRSVVLKTEFERFYSYVQTLRADGKVGSVMNYKKVGEYLVLWDLGKTPEDYDVIRLYNEHKDGTDAFAVSYYRSKQIVPGRTVIRRFVGPGIVGWRNDTMDLATGEYLGMQGVREPYMNNADRKLVQKYKIRLFN